MKTTRQPGVGIVLLRRYGHSTILAYETHEGGAVRRVEQYKPRDGGSVVERPFAARIGDVSAHVLMYDPDGAGGRRYDAACACCYLGYPHTVEKHDRALALIAAPVVTAKGTRP